MNASTSLAIPIAMMTAWRQGDEDTFRRLAGEAGVREFGAVVGALHTCLAHLADAANMDRDEYLRRFALFIAESEVA